MAKEYEGYAIGDRGHRSAADQRNKLRDSERDAREGGTAPAGYVGKHTGKGGAHRRP